MRVLLVIEIPFYRDGLGALLSQSADVVVIGAVADARAALQVASMESLDVVLLDIGASQARETLLQLRELEHCPPVVALAIAETPESIAEWAEAGVMGYVSRTAGLADLLQCLQHAARGETYCSPRVMSIMLHRLAAVVERQRVNVSRSDHLTRREREILELVGCGNTNKQIAAQLNISYTTAKNHVHNILEKLQLQGRAQVAAFLSKQPDRRERPGSQIHNQS